MQLHRIRNVDQPSIDVHEAHLMRFAFQLARHGFTPQQAHHLIHVAAHIGELHAVLTHGAPCGKARADTKIDASRRELVQRRKTIRRHGRETIARHQHTGAEAN